MSTLPASETLVVVSFEESEVIGRGGATLTTYRALVDRVWTPVCKLTNAVVRSSSPTPGVVWSRTVEVPLRVGTKVERQVESPWREPQADVGNVLFGRSRGSRRQRRTFSLVVDAHGRLQNAPRP